MTRRVRSEEAGLGLVEVMAGLAIGLMVLLGVHSVLSNSAISSRGHQNQLEAQDLAARELEKVLQIQDRYGFEAIALTAKPPEGPSQTPIPAVPSDPDDWTVNWASATPSYKIAQDFHDSALPVVPGTPADGEPMVIGSTTTYPTTGQVTPRTTTTTQDGRTALIHRYVTEHAEPCSQSGQCTGEARRVIVAVTVDPPGKTSTTPGNTQHQLSKPIYSQILVTAPVPRVNSSRGGLKIGVQLT